MYSCCTPVVHRQLSIRTPYCTEPTPTTVPPYTVPAVYHRQLSFRTPFGTVGPRTAAALRTPWAVTYSSELCRLVSGWLCRADHGSRKRITMIIARHRPSATGSVSAHRVLVRVWPSVSDRVCPVLYVRGTLVHSYPSVVHGCSTSVGHLRGSTCGVPPWVMTVWPFLLVWTNWRKLAVIPHGLYRFRSSGRPWDIGQSR